MEVMCKTNRRSVLTDCLDLLEGDDEDEPEESSNVLPPALGPTTR